MAPECSHPLQHGVERLLVLPGRDRDAESLVACPDLLAAQQPEAVGELLDLRRPRAGEVGRRHLDDGEVVSPRAQVGEDCDDAVVEEQVIATTSAAGGGETELPTSFRRS